MNAALGWTVLSKDALRRAEAQLNEDVQGVSDEIGFLALHQAYANRFFPGTSVSQTRLRYILFVPWIYNDISTATSSKKVYQEIQRREIELAGRLRHLGLGKGVIGGKSYPRPTSQPATMVYWTALKEWGILRPLQDGSYPSRAQAHRHISKLSPQSSLRDADKQLLNVSTSLFVSLPQTPKVWQNSKVKMDFVLTKDEEQFIRQILIAVNRPNAGGKPNPTLLSTLVENQIAVSNLDKPWAPEILRIIDSQEREALIRAHQVSALSAISRAVYAAHVELLREQEDHLPTGNIHRKNLDEVISIYSADARQLDIQKVQEDAPQLTGSSILEILWATKQWLNKPQDITLLLDLYQSVEITRKGQRARLSNTLAGQKRRAEWYPEEPPKAYPLSYRWSKVKRLLSDLVEAG